MSRHTVSALVLFVAIVLATFFIAFQQISKVEELKSENLKLQQRTSDLKDQKANLEKRNEKLSRQLIYYKSAYGVNYQMVVNEFADLSDRFEAKEGIQISEVKSAVIDLQHVYSLLNFEQRDSLAKQVNDLMYGTTLMDAFPPEQADQVWKLVGAIQWREETN